MDKVKELSEALPTHDSEVIHIEVCQSSNR